VRLSAPDLVVPSPLELHNGGAPAPAGGGVTAAPRPRPVSTVAPRKLAPAHPGTRTGATNVASGTALVSMHRGHIDAFWRGTDNGLWHQWRDLAYRDGGWVPPERIGRFTFTKAPAAASWGDNRIDVMMRGTDGRLYQVYFDGVWHDVPTQVMPGGRPAAPAGSPALTSRHAGHLDVFWRDNNSHLMHSWYDSRYWGSSATFEGPEQLGGATQMSSDPAVASPDDYRTDVFARSSRHGLLHLYWVDRAGWSPWAIVPGVSNVVTAPTAVCQRGNEYPHNMAVAYQGLDGQLWHVWSLDSSRWHAPVSLGGAPVTAPGAASWSDRRVDVVFRDAAGALRHKYYDGAWHL
jgi:hypothetical protein